MQNIKETASGKTGLIKSIIISMNRELKRILRDREILFLTILLPLLLSFLLLQIYGNGAIRKLPVAILDNDRSELSTTMKLAIQSSSAMEIVIIANSIAEIENAFKAGKIQGAFYFPYHMENDLKKNKQVYPVLYKNSQNIISSSFLLKESQSIFRTFNGGILLKKLRSKGLTEQQAMGIIKPVNVDATILYNANFNYKVFLSPGIIFAQLQLIFMIGGLLLITREFKQNSFRQALFISGNRFWLVMLSKLSVMVLWSTISVLIITGVFFKFFGIDTLNFPITTAVVILYVTASVSLGMALGSLLRDTLLSIEIAIFLGMPSFMLSGYTFPLWAVPDILTYLSEILPFTHFYTAYFKISQMNAPMHYAFPEIIRLSLIIFIPLLIILILDLINGYFTKRSQKKASLNDCSKFEGSNWFTILFKREINIVSTNPCLIMILFAGPIVYPFLYNSIYMNKFERDIPITVVDLDNSEYSRKMTTEMDAHELLKVSFIGHDIEEAHHQLRSFKSMAILIIPNGYESDLKKMQQTRIHVAINNTRFMVASDINKALGEVISNNSRQTIQLLFQKTGYSQQQATALSDPIHLTINNCFNFTDSYGDSMIAALLLLILHQTLLIGVALSVASEREDRKMPELILLSKSSAFRIIAGKGFPYILLYFSYTMLFFTFQSHLYKIPFHGSYLALTILLTVTFISVIAMAHALASVFKTRLMALIVFMVSSYPLFLMSGYAWPLQSIPEYLQLIATLLPSTPLFDAYVVCTKMGGTIRDIIPQIIHIASLGIFYYVLFAIMLSKLKRGTPE